MAVGQATPLVKPLPSGTQDALVKLHPLLGAEMLSPMEFMSMTGGKLKAIRSMLGSRRDWITIPIPAYLLEHPSAGLILVDTGFHPSVAVDPAQNLGPLLGRMYKDVITMKPEQAIPAQLRKLGFEPSQVGTVIMTHLHMDHASGISEFVKPTYVLGEGEWDAFHKYGARHGYVHKHVAHALDFREVLYSDGAISSYSTFGRTFDLFGDGSIRLAFTPGHSEGHQSLILRTASGEVLLTGDACYFAETLENERHGYAMAKGGEHKWRRSLREIQLFKREHPNATIIPGHDPKAWASLKQIY